MILKISVILDVKEEVVRTFLIDGDHFLYSLHTTIKEVFGFKGNEFASYCLLDKNGNKKGEDIHLFAGMIDAEDELEVKTMENTTISEVLSNPNDVLMYTYGMMSISLWRFQVVFLEVVEDLLKKDETYRLLLSFGEIHEQMASASEQDVVLFEANDFEEGFESLPDDDLY